MAPTNLEIPYKLHRTVAGAVRLKYLCPRCQEKLESSIEEAGNQDACPACATGFVVPGALQLQQHLKRLAETQVRKQENQDKRQEALKNAAKTAVTAAGNAGSVIERILQVDEEQIRRRVAAEHEHRAIKQAQKDHGNRYNSVPSESVDLRSLAFEINDLQRLLRSARDLQFAAGLVLVLAGCVTGILALGSDTSTVLAGGLFWIGIAKMIGG